MQVINQPTSQSKPQPQPASVPLDLQQPQLPKLTYIKFACLTALLVIFCLNLYHFVGYLLISNRIKNGEKAADGELLGHLEYLTGITMPIFKHFFYEEYIYQLTRNKLYEQAITEANRILATPEHSQKFSIHYHKAMCLCFLQKFKQCKEAIQESYKYATKEKLGYIRSIYDILLSNGWVKVGEIPSGAQFWGVEDGKEDGKGKGLGKEAKEAKVKANRKVVERSPKMESLQFEENILGSL